MPNAWMDSLAGAGDFLAGSTDEAVARTTDDQSGGGIFDGTADTADDLAGSTDEAVSRQFDDQEGGGFADGDTFVSAADDLAGSTDEWFDRTISGAADHAAGSTDESVARQFDDQQGGGSIDVLADVTAGVGDWLGGDVDEWIGQNTMQAQLLVGLVILMVLLYLVRPALTAGANASGG